ncbi:uncharacterized protein PODANS_4_5340 [Podospora anserina S mat+]|uniref:Podospora anserina S mat+ genomic DNA chromosome 4, supercontig 4 n=1 Tax=Podospora anserina (strain S / ATCC MYA-4624 / DSM 980 / FGSC 10383) TaxID=515849 RepID=B2AQ48_PODAN|nr:uncharacterized protein PODANS_4_5340 [Podospora anserina S mat+]CAP66987.1 unnamed protein product [Podospora anserina S mat+]CDP28729.1 Putative protein of unknown function [Podospora anserina S mat+]
MTRMIWRDKSPNTSEVDRCSVGLMVNYLCGLLVAGRRDVLFCEDIYHPAFPVWKDDVLSGSSTRMLVSNEISK